MKFVENASYIVVVLVVGIVVGMLLSAIFGERPASSFVKLSPTGYFSITGGSTTSTGEQNASNPYEGAIKGYIAFTIIDPETNDTVSVEPGDSYPLYLAIDTYTPSDFGLIKDNLADYSGNLTNIDADGSESNCVYGNYSTDNYYYDLDDDDYFNTTAGDFEVFLIVTDSYGCFGALLPVGNYTIWG